MKITESQMQQQIINWCNLRINKYQCLKFIHHSPNGGKRNKTEAVRFKKEGVKPGFPDLILPYPNKGYNGLFIELKTKAGRLSSFQTEWGEYLEENGYKFVVVRSFDKFVEVIECYLEKQTK